jgi:hypothetical protein
MIGPSLIIERNKYDDIDREHKDPLPPTELANSELIVELIYQYTDSRKYREESDQFHDVKIRDRLYLGSDPGATDVAYQCQESACSECEDRDGEDVGVEIERHRRWCVSRIGYWYDRGARRQEVEIG